MNGLDTETDASSDVNTIIEVHFTDEEIEQARLKRHEEREQKYYQQNLEDELEDKRATRKFMKKIILRFVIPLTLIGFIGFILVGVGTGLPSTPITTTGIVMTCVGFIPQLIFLIIHAYRKGIPIWW